VFCEQTVVTAKATTIKEALQRWVCVYICEW